VKEKKWEGQEHHSKGPHEKMETYWDRKVGMQLNDGQGQEKMALDMKRIGKVRITPPT
jgi:hypothetical protein